jgi:hypothetical protein
METYPGPFRLSGITAATGFMVRDGWTGTAGVPGTIEVQIWTRYWGYQ